MADLIRYNNFHELKRDKIGNVDSSSALHRHEEMEKFLTLLRRKVIEKKSPRDASSKKS